MVGVHARIDDRDPHALAGKHLRHAVEAHLELAPAVSEVVREPRDGLLDGAKPYHVHLAIHQLGVVEIFIPVVAWRTREQGTRTLAGERDQRKRHLAPLVCSTLLRESLASETHSDIGEGPIALADHPELDRAGLDAAGVAPGGQPSGR